MQDMKLIELLNDARDKAHRDVQLLRQEMQKELAFLRADISGTQRKLIRAVIILGLALGGKDLVSLVLK